MAFEEIRTGFDAYMESIHQIERQQKIEKMLKKCEILLNIPPQGSINLTSPTFPIRKSYARKIHISFVTPVWDKDFYQHIICSEPKFIQIPRSFQKYEALWEYLKNNPNTFIW